MLPYLAVLGYTNYVKLLALFLEKMDKMEETHETIYWKYMEGLFVLRHSDNHCAGIFSDLHIEQVFMWNIKSVGGLTTGRDFHETTTLVWLLSANYNLLSIIW